MGGGIGGIWGIGYVREMFNEENPKDDFVVCWEKNVTKLCRCSWLVHLRLRTYC